MRARLILVLIPLLGWVGLAGSVNVGRPIGTSVSAAATTAPPRDGYFYAVDARVEEDRLFRVDWDGTITPIGDVGQLGFPEVRNIVWDWGEERLFGYESLLDVWLEINTTTGTATQLGSGLPFDWDALTYNSVDRQLYGLRGSYLWMIDKETGDREEAGTSGPSRSLAHAVDTTGGLDGMFIHAGGLFLLPDTNYYEALSLGGATTNPHALMWSPNDDLLLRFSRGASVAEIYELNQVTGDDTLLVEWDIGEDSLLIGSITFVPGNPDPQPACTVMDADGDGAITLRDFAEFAACLDASGPQP